ncbi:MULTISPECIES: DUF979 domain-containing protein [Staphylococcus]|uniref:DUF979 domain-containing protein n=1 Tax=Staphylococcus pettenkoferi TaxID=170573 RepID=A0A2N6QH96_9STAP|nr:MULTISPECIES: DUF979 domain-containing protein [Staphylococcus]MCI2791451.1 DUF979 domain-containing protein [Staphylococcus pettenkoferi]MCY1567152.1 DUF979 domain-containing protein [Staphylococcus pettenkoferi]MCY1588506.1 DUF979 domain-containing protein [Staphylococcus pettenkoferi]MCY1604331.1 DUF979 domain-containing protein [Staphylococcus pettenkoferi]OFK77976.1 hypothetical protein HMPREF2802_08410 [Staphylococcus sp. HMSC071G07]
MSETVINRILECFYILAGLQFIYTAYRALKAPDKGKRVGTALFWLILAILFIAGPYLPNVINGLLIVLMGVLTLFKQVTIKNIIDVNESEVEQGARRYGNKLFIPALVLAVVAVIVSNWTPLGGAIGLGVSSVVGLIAALLVIKPKAKYILYDSDRLTQQVGAVGILPQFLAALGVLFTASGVGKVISHGISSFLPEGSHLVGSIAYILGMVLFTMLMGNAFAAFTVITASIGIPFVIAQGGDPVIAGALAMTGGFCGTLITPMAANFNTLPVALLEMKDEFGVIKAQLPVALLLIVAHIALMYFWAF